jgi:signal transduction histidine kinase
MVDLGTPKPAFNGRARRKQTAPNVSPAEIPAEIINLEDADTALSALLQHMAEGLVLIDEQHRLVTVNPLCADILGLSAELTAPGCPVSAILDHLAATGLFEAGFSALEQGLRGSSPSPATEVGKAPVELVRAELVRAELVRVDGRIFQMRRERAPGLGHLCLFADVTDRRQAEADLVKSARLLRETLDSVDALIVVYDADNRYILGNRRYHERYPHLPPDEVLVGKSFEEMLRLSLAAGHVAEELARTDPEAFIARRLREFRKLTPDRRDARGRWLLGRGQVTLNGNWVSLRVDITEQKRAEEALRQAKEITEASLALEKMARAQQNQFIAMISHEFRTPLSIIDSTTQNIAVAGGDRTPEGRQRLDKIRRAVRRMLNMIDTYLTEDRSNGPTLALHSSRFDFVKLLEDLLEDKRLAHRSCALTIEANAVDEPIRGDRDLLRIALSNLVENAIKYSLIGSPIAIRAHRQGERLVIAVEDRGIGIPAADLDRIFEKYYRADNKGDAHGAGLGLYLVRRIAESHSGTVTVRSRLGEGSTFTLTLPEAWGTARRGLPDLVDEQAE